jgi:Polysaccharide lyase
LGSSAFAPQNTSTCLPVSVYDDFEAPTLNKLWQTILLAPGALKLQSGVVHAGHGAAEITLRAHDRFEAGINGDSDSERDELVEGKALVARTEVDCAYEYSFSMFLPTTFPIVPTRLVIAQWKQYCPDQLKMLNGSSIAAKGNRVCSNDSPILAIRYMSNALSLTQDINKEHTIVYERKGEFRNRWLDFEFKVRFSPRTAGKIQTWLDNKQIVNFSGATANPENTATGYPSPSHYYFKMGLYRNVMTKPMTIYVDEYRKKSLPQAEF